MKRQFFLILALLFIHGFKAVSPGPKAVEPFEPYKTLVKMDADGNELPADGKEQRTELLKILDKPSLIIISFDLSAQPLRYFEFTQRLKRQVFLSVQLPPPRLVA